VTITYSDAGAGKWRTKVEVVLPDGKAAQAITTYVPDGTGRRQSGNRYGGDAAARTGRDGHRARARRHPASMRIYTGRPTARR
jgi:hypothetical protein